MADGYGYLPIGGLLGDPNQPSSGLLSGAQSAFASPSLGDQSVAPPTYDPSVAFKDPNAMTWRDKAMLAFSRLSDDPDAYRKTLGDIAARQLVNQYSDLFNSAGRGAFGAQPAAPVGHSAGAMPPAAYGAPAGSDRLSALRAATVRAQLMGAPNASAMQGLLGQVAASQLPGQLLTTEGKPVPMADAVGALMRARQLGVDITPYSDLLTKAQPEYDVKDGAMWDKKTGALRPGVYGAHMGVTPGGVSFNEYDPNGLPASGNGPPPKPGYVPQFDPSTGRFIGWHDPNGTASAAIAADAGAAARGAAPYTKDDRTDANGAPIYGVLSDRLNTGAPAAAGPAGGLLGHGQSPGEKTFAEEQAKDASSVLSSDMAARQGALDNINSAKQALGYISQYRSTMNPTAGFQVAGANYLRSLPAPMLKSIGIDPNDPNGPDKFANNAAIYQQLSSKDLLSFSKSNLPSRYTEREMMVANRVIPQLTTAPDAAAFHWGLQAAIANKALQRAEFAANYKGAPTRQSVEQNWNSTPQGQQSLFQDPIWQNVQIGGQPAVVYFKSKGAQYGAFGKGTGHPQFFKVVQ